MTLEKGMATSSSISRLAVVPWGHKVGQYTSAYSITVSPTWGLKHFEHKFLEYSKP